MTVRLQIDLQVVSMLGRAGLATSDCPPAYRPVVILFPHEISPVAGGRSARGTLPPSPARCGRGLCDVAEYVGDYERATALQSESLALSREIGNKQGIAFVLRNLSRVAVHQSDCERAAVYFQESLILCRETGDPWLSGQCLEGLARTASVEGYHERAARLIGVVAALYEALGWRPSPFDQALHDRYATFTRANLGEASFEEMSAEGQAMTLEQAIEYALAPDVQ